MKSFVAIVALIAASPAFAQDPLAPLPPASEPIVTTPAPTPAPDIVAPPPAPAPVLIVPRDWRGVFAAIRAQQWAAASAGIAALPPGPLSAVARAELYTAKNSPPVELAAIAALLAEAPELPQAGQLQRLAVARGATETPPIAGQWRIVPLASAPRRHRSRPVAGEPVADTLRLALEPYVETRSAPEAEALFQQSLPLLSYEARAEAAHRVAWIYYVLGRDQDARRIAESGLPGAIGEWAAQAHWIAGLAAWRLNDCASAATHFRAVASGRAESELAAAANYWAARSEMACGRPHVVAPLLKAAARSPESFYGLVARETLGMDKGMQPLTARPNSRVESLPNVGRALLLAEIGEYVLADDLIRHQARIGNPADHVALIALTKRISFAGVQYWLAHNGPQGVTVPAAARFPLPNWMPSGGWRVDPALAFAHARQESDFRPGAVSPAGAVGLMQVLPGTAGDLARGRGTAVGDLRHPSTNLEYGQSFIEKMRGNPFTQGQLPKVIAAYNAGPLPVSRWNYINDKGDPLLWIESLPYWETRYYVPAVLRNMWVYQMLGGAPQPTLKAVAEHKWPAFPTSRTNVAATRN